MATLTKKEFDLIRTRRSEADINYLLTLLRDGTVTIDDESQTANEERRA